jgi:hypothetical protein
MIFCFVSIYVFSFMLLAFELNSDSFGVIRCLTAGKIKF